MKVWTDLPRWAKLAAVIGALGIGVGLALRSGGFGVKFLKQADPRWGGKVLGFSSENIATGGCFLTAVTMAANALTGTDWTPDEAGDIMKEGNGFQGVLIVLENAARSLGMRLGKVVAGNASAMANAVDEALSRGGGAIMKVTHHAGSRTHFVLIHGKNAKGYVAADPAFGTDVFIDPSTMTAVAPNATLYTGVNVDQLFKA